MRVFNFHAMASLNRQIRKILPQIPSLATKKVQEPGARGVEDPYPRPPQRNLQTAPAPSLQGGSTAPGNPVGVQTQPAPRGAAHPRPPRGPRAPRYLMLPFGGRLLFHLRHKHTRHFPLHRAQAPHGGSTGSTSGKRAYEQRRVRARTTSTAVSRVTQATHVPRAGPAAALPRPPAPRWAGTHARKRPPGRGAFWEL